MKKIYTIFLALIFIGEMSAQENNFKGYWVKAYGGAIFNNSFNLRSELNDPKFNNKKFSIENANLGASFGLGGMMILDGNFLVGINANYGSIVKKSNEVVNVSLKNWSALANFGALLYNKNDMIIYPYMGVGYAQYAMNVKNLSTSDIIYDFYDPITPDATQKYVSGYTLFELGVGVAKKVINNWTLGFDVGTYFSPDKLGSWKKDGEVVKYRKAPTMNGAYARLTIGYSNINTK